MRNDKLAVSGRSQKAWWVGWHLAPTLCSPRTGGAGVRGRDAVQEVGRWAVTGSAPPPVWEGQGQPPEGRIIKRETILVPQT